MNKINDSYFKPLNSGMICSIVVDIRAFHLADETQRLNLLLKATQLANAKDICPVVQEFNSVSP